MKTFYLTTPIYYVNARPHLGHAYTTIVADAIARYKRLGGHRVALVTGTDEHGQKIERAALEAGVEPQKFVDTISAEFRSQWERLGLEYTHFERTTSADHRKAVEKIFQAVQASGHIYKGHYRGRYCFHDEAFVTDTGEEAECPLCGRPTELVEEENYFFRLSAFEQPLLDYYQKHPAFIRPETRRNEVISFVKEGLRDLSISREKLKWGIPMPGVEGQVFYVWFDALTSYLSGVGYGHPGTGEEKFADCWPADLHLVGKEILRFHAVYWPAFLMAAKLPLPKAIFAHGWLIFEQDKMSKSKGNIVKADPLVAAVGIDGLRYYLMRNIVFGQDSNFSYEGLVQRFNSDLANDLGNLASRTLAMIGRYFKGSIPDPGPEAVQESREAAIIEAAGKTISEFQSKFDNFEFSRGIELVWRFISNLNKYLVETEPWVLAGKEDEASKARLATVLYTSAEALRITAVLLYPVIPTAMQKLWAQLGFPEPLENMRYANLAWGQLPLAQKTGQAEVIFPRLDKEKTIARLSAGTAIGKAVGAAAGKATGKATGKAAEPASKPQKGISMPPDATDSDFITIDDFSKVDLRAGEIKSAERIEGATRLLKLTVDIGAEVRQVLAGIAEHYQPEDLVGMKVVVVANLKPRKMRGLESQGMVVAASVGEEGKPVLVTFNQDVPNGSKLS